MTRLLAIVLLSSICVVAAQSGATAQSDQEPAVTIRTGVQEVLLDLVVRDARGRIVKNLHPNDLEILEDGAPQQIRSFRFVPGAELIRSARKSANAAATPTAPAAGPATPLRAVNLICIVYHNLDIYDPSIRKSVSDALRDFVGQLPRDTWVGLFSLGQDLVALHPFTTRREELLQAAAQPFTGITVDFASVALDILSASPNQQTLDVVMNGNPASGGSVKATLRTTGGEVSKSAITGADVSTGAGANARRGDLFSQQRVFGRIEGMRETDQILAMIERLKTLPGRKSVLLVSPGLASAGDPELFKAVIEKANRADITVYGLDVNGLSQNSNGLASENVLSHAVAISATQAQRTTGNGSGAANMEKMRQDDYVNQAVRASDPQASLRELSEQTGGFLIANTNDFRKSFERLMQDVDTHYEVVYRPASNKYDGRLRTISVKTKRAGLTVQSRTGYFAVPGLSANAQARPWETLALAALNVPTPPHAFEFRSATFQFRPGAPDSENALLFEVPAAFHSGAVGAPPRADVGVVALVKDSTGQVVNAISVDAPDEAGREAAAGKLLFTRRVSLPPGHYTLESAAVNRVTDQCSVARTSFEVAEQKGIGLSSIVPIALLEPLKTAADRSDPLEFRGGSAQALRVIPDLTSAASQPARPQVYFVVYPDRFSGEKPTIRVDLLSGGRVTATQTSKLPAPDPSGAIPMLIHAPCDAAGCELRITAIQGNSQNTQSLAWNKKGS